MKKVKWRIRAAREYLRFQADVLSANVSARISRSNSLLSTPLCFVTGCGRSGTTLLGQLLALHPDIIYLNEPRPFWIAIALRTDIWGYCHALPTSSLIMAEPDADEVARFQALFEKVSRSKRMLVEKTPENVFRLRWLHGLGPQAKLIHIVRNGFDVIRSILREADFNIPYGVKDMNNWYGAEGIKKIMLANTAHGLGIEQSVVESCNTQYDWAALEWICSLLAYCRDKHLFEESGVHELRYEDLTSNNTLDVYSELLEFLNLPAPMDIGGKITAYVRPRKKPADAVELSPPLRDLFFAIQEKYGYE